MLKNYTIYSTMNNRGLTLVELMITLAVLAVLLAIAAPQFSSVSTSNKLTAKINSLSGDMAYARSEAITRNTNVTIAAEPGGWSDGWRVFVDANNNGSFDNATDTLLKVGESIQSNITVTSGETGVTFKSNGAKSNTTVFSLKLCESSKSVGKSVEVMASGSRTLNSKANCP